MSSFETNSDILLKGVFPDLAARWRRVCEDMWTLHQKRIKVVDGFRTNVRQWEIFSQGRKKLKNGKWIVVDEKKIVTKSMPGSSCHQYGLAIDSAFVGPDPYLKEATKEERKFLWKEYGRLAQLHGLQWGGDWNGNGKEDRDDWDLGHVQIRYGFSMNKIQEFYENGGVKGVWAKCEALILCGSALVKKEETV